MSQNITDKLSVQLIAKNTVDEDIDRLTRKLKEELAYNDSFSVDLKKRPKTTTDSKAIDPVFVGALLIAVSPNLISTLIETLYGWAIRQMDKTLKFKIQKENGASIEVEVPESMSRKEAGKWAKQLAEVLNELD